MKIGYARVSTNKQELHTQIQLLQEHGCEKIFSEIISGAKEQRLQLNAMIEQLRKGDIVVVVRIDRLGRSLKQLLSVLDTLNQKKADFICLTQNFNTTTIEGKLFFSIVGAFAEFEREMIKKRVNEGVKKARARGIIGGRPKGIANVQKAKYAYFLYNVQRKKVEVAMKEAKIGSRTTFFKYVKIIEQQNREKATP